VKKLVFSLGEMHEEFRIVAVVIQQQGHSGKALEKKKYGGRNSGTETKI
jgi:hypothetical protein